MGRLHLPQVTLCAIDTRAPALAAQALWHSMRQVDFGRALLFTHGWVPPVVLPGVELVEIDPITSAAAYSHFVLRKLPGCIRSSHALLVQWDGFVLDAAAWNDEFLVHDYIGAVWPDQPEALQVGKGGFSLRSRRFLLAGLDPRITVEHPEDQVMCRDQRTFLQQAYGISFAPPALARRFATPDGGSGSFGFLGVRALARRLGERDMVEVLQRLPDDRLPPDEAARLARWLVLRGMPAAARECLRKVESQGTGSPRLLGAAVGIVGALRAGRQQA
jgi:hypothetical protein